MVAMDVVPVVVVSVVVVVGAAEVVVVVVLVVVGEISSRNGISRRLTSFLLTMRLSYFICIARLCLGVGVVVVVTGVGAGVVVVGVRVDVEGVAGVVFSIGGLIGRGGARGMSTSIAAGGVMLVIAARDAIGV